MQKGEPHIYARPPAPPVPHSSSVSHPLGSVGPKGAEHPSILHTSTINHPLGLLRPKGQSILHTSTTIHPLGLLRPKGTEHPTHIHNYSSARSAETKRDQASKHRSNMYTIPHPWVLFHKKGGRNSTTPPIPHPSIFSHPLGSVRPKGAKHPSILHTSTIIHQYIHTTIHEVCET